MTYSAKNELVKLLDTPRRCHQNRYDVMARIMRKDLPHSDVCKWEIQLLPNSIYPIHLDSVIQHIQKIEYDISMYMDHTGSCGISLM